MAFDSIQPIALRIREDALPLMRDCITLSFPKHWAEAFKKLQADIHNHPPEKTSIPIASLNRTLRAVVPPIISIGRRVTSKWAIEQGKPWLYLHSAIDPAILINVVHAWARVMFSAVAAEKLNQILETVQTHDVKWKIEQLDLVDWQANAAGTTIPGNPGQFILFPDYVAATLGSIADGFQYGDHQLHFRRSSLAPGQKGAELTSWPPLSHGDALYSVVLTFSLQIVPFQPYPVLYCDVSMRRWAGPRRVHLRQRASTYISTKLPFVPGLEDWSNQLQVASLARRPDQNDGWKTYWEDQLVEILAQFKSPVSLIDAEQLVASPEIGQRQWDDAAAIVYSTRLGRHPIGAGIAIRDRGQLFDQIIASLNNVFEPLDPMPRTKIGLKKKVTLRPNAFFDKIGDETAKKLSDPERAVIRANNAGIWSRRRALVRETVGDNLSIDIRTSTTAVREALIIAVWEVLGIDLKGNVDEEVTTPELTITVHFGDLGSLAVELNVARGKGVRERVRNETQRRISEIARSLPKIQQPLLMLAEIMPKGKYLNNNCDPKSALRIGIARTGRLVQFITADSDKTEDAVEESEEEEATASLYYRAVNALLDGLRQLGVPGKLPDSAKDGRPRTIIGAWLINKKSSKPGNESYTLPVLVRMSSADNDIWALAPGFTDWLPYRNALIELAKKDAFGNQGRRSDYPAFFQAELRKLVLEDRDTLLICHAQNMRETWKWLSNTNLTPDAIAFREGETPVTMEEWPGLRVVRVRDGQSHETPEWFAEGADGSRSASKGLFTMGERVYASTHDKPKQMTKYSHYLSKVEEWTSPRKPDKIRLATPSTSTWNPGLYEITVVTLQPEDQGDSSIWANLVHELRKSCLHFEDATALPLPLHLARLMEEYILSIDIDDEEEEV